MNIRNFTCRCRELVSPLLTSGPDQRHPVKARAPRDRLRRLVALTGYRWPGVGWSSR
jgi:hypothetical protein